MRFLPMASKRLARLRAMLPEIIRVEREAFARRRPYWDASLPPARRLHLPK